MVRGTPQFSSVRRSLTLPGAVDWVTRPFAAFLAWLVYWDDLARQRRALSRLDDRQLKDIGVTRMEADEESRRWSAPWWSP